MTNAVSGSRTDFVAVMPRAEAEAAVAAEPGLTLVAQGDLAAVFAPAAGPRPSRFALLRPGLRRALGAALVARQRMLEALHGHGCVLPAAPGATLRPAEAPATLAANRALLVGRLAALRGLSQHQLTVGWDPAAALRRFAVEPELAGRRTAAALAEGAAALRSRLGADFAARLVAPCADAVALPTDGPATLTNLVTLTDMAGLARLEAAMESVDATWPEGLSLRLTGPLPAISFCALTVERPGAGALAAARQRLGLPNGAADRDTVRAAFRRAARASHPDHGAAAAAGDAVAALRDAESLLLWAADAQEGLAAAGLDGPVPRLSALREGEAAPTRKNAA